jgi:hypothetical protein
MAPARKIVPFCFRVRQRAAITLYGRFTPTAVNHVVAQTLTVHHLTSRGKSGDDAEENLITRLATATAERIGQEGY